METIRRYVHCSPEALTRLPLGRIVKETKRFAPAGFWPLTRGGIIVSPAYTYKECGKYWCSMRINPDLMKLSAHGDPG